MQTRRDHVQAYAFAMGRLATALVTGDPGRGESPTRRATLGTFLGAGAAALLCVGYGVYGLISPPATSAWRAPGSIIVEKETGNRYLYLKGELRPVRNYASALLIAGKGAKVLTVSRASLAQTPRGRAVGVPNAPDTLPTAAGLLPGRWTRCLRPDLSIGESDDFSPAGHTRPLPLDRQVLLSGPGGKRYLLWRGTLYPVPSDATLIALGLDGDQAIAAPRTWLSQLPKGATLAAPAIAHYGSAAGRVAGRPVTVGQLFVTDTGGTRHHYVMTAEGIAPVSATQAALLAARAGAPAVREVNASDVAAAPVSHDTSLAAELPDLLQAPQLPRTAGVVCLDQSAKGAAVITRMAVEGGPAADGARSVLVPPDTGVYAVDQQQLAAQRQDPATYLITDQGVAYPLSGRETAADLGLTTSPVPLPEVLLAVLPHGPTLDTDVANATVGGA